MTGRYALPELAERAGMTLEEVHDLIKAGVLEPTPDQTVPTTALNRVRLAHALTQHIPLENLARAIESQSLHFRFLDALFANPVPLEPTTYGEMAEELGVDFDNLAQLYSTWELPAPAPDQLLRKDDVQMLDALRLLARQGSTFPHSSAERASSARTCGGSRSRKSARSSRRSSSPCWLRGRRSSRCSNELRR